MKEKEAIVMVNNEPKVVKVAMNVHGAYEVCTNNDDLRTERAVVDLYIDGAKYNIEQVTRWKYGKKTIVYKHQGVYFYQKNDVIAHVLGDTGQCLLATAHWNECLVSIYAQVNGWCEDKDVFPGNHTCAELPATIYNELDYRLGGIEAKMSIGEALKTIKWVMKEIR